MKEFLKRIWKNIKRGFMIILISSWYVWLAAIIAIIVSLIWNVEIGIWVFFGVVLSFVGFIFLRQIWWWVTKTGDYKSSDEDKN